MQRWETQDKFCISRDLSNTAYCHRRALQQNTSFVLKFETPGGWQLGNPVAIRCNAATARTMSPPQPSGDVGQTRDGRLTFQEMTSLVPLPDRLESGNTIKRFMSRRKAWRIGDDVPLLPNTLAYGGCKRSLRSLT